MTVSQAYRYGTDAAVTPGGSENDHPPALYCPSSSNPGSTHTRLIPIAASAAASGPYAHTVPAFW